MIKRQAIYHSTSWGMRKNNLKTKRSEICFHILFVYRWFLLGQALVVSKQTGSVTGNSYALIIN